MWSLANPHKTPPADPPMTLRAKLRESTKLIPCLLLIVFVFVSLLLGWATATECAAWGVLGSLAIAWWHGALTWDVVLGERDGGDAGHLHDHADPCRRLLHVHLDGLYRHSDRARELGGRPPPVALRA